jgi:hypothetical protein
MNKEILNRYAAEVIGEIKNEELLEEVIEITLDLLGRYELYNYQIKEFMHDLYMEGVDMK